MANTSSSASSKAQGNASSMAELMNRRPSSFQVFKKGQEVDGVVKKLTSSEILLDIGAKSDALVLEVEKTNMDNLMASLHVGDHVKAVILSPEAEEGFPVVSLRRMLDNKIYADFDKSLKSDEIVSITVLEPTRGGYFAEAENGVKGFLPTSQSLGENVAGKKIEVKIIEVDRSKKRVIFSQKATQFETNADTLKKLFARGQKVKATVAQVASYGLFVIIDGVGKQAEGFVHISEISYDRIENLQALYKTGDTLEAGVLDVDPENRRVNLSVKSLRADSFNSVSEKYKKEDKVKGTVTKVSSRGVTVELEKGVSGFIPADKIPADTTYKVGEAVSAEVSDIDTKRRVVVISPIVTKTFVGYR